VSVDVAGAGPSDGLDTDQRGALTAPTLKGGASTAVKADTKIR
jgi:hypothetical protein